MVGVVVYEYYFLWYRTDYGTHFEIAGKIYVKVVVSVHILKARGLRLGEARKGPQSVLKSDLPRVYDIAASQRWHLTLISHFREA